MVLEYLISILFWAPFFTFRACIFNLLKNTVKVCLILGMVFFAFTNVPLFALEESDMPFIPNFMIGTETIRTNGVLICRPLQVDTRILNIIKANKIQSFADYVKWLKQNIEYRKDSEGDRWSRPEETIEKAFGDCEDYAFLNAAFLRVLGYKAQVLATGNGKQYHAICVFQYNGFYVWFDNSEIKRTCVSSMMAFADYLFENYCCSSISELNFDSKSWNILFRKA